MVLFRLARTVAFPPPSYSNIFAAYCGPCAFTFALKSIPVGILMVLFTLFGNSCFTKRTSCKLPRKARFADRFLGFAILISVRPHSKPCVLACENIVLQSKKVGIASQKPGYVYAFGRNGV